MESRLKEEQMEHIWDSFYTTSQKKKPVTSENEVRNIGLGLFVVRKIVDKHKGSCGAKKYGERSAVLASTSGNRGFGKMRKWNRKTKIAVFIIFLILAVLFAALCWKNAVESIIHI